MKKTLALLMTLALLAGALAVPALAEENSGAVDQVTSATSQAGQNNQAARGGRRQMPGQNSQNNQGSQMPRMPGQSGQDSQNGQMPQMPGRNGRWGRGMNSQAGKGGKQLIFDQLLADNVITQEVYDAITAWINEHMQQNAAAPAAGSETPARPEGMPAEGAPAEGTQAPAQPESAQAGSTEAQEQLLKELLDSGAITQEQYDLLAGGLQAVPALPDAPAAPAGT